MYATLIQNHLYKYATKAYFLSFLLIFSNYFGFGQVPQITNGRLDSLYYYQYKSPKDSILASREVNQYDLKGNLIRVIRDSLNVEKKIFEHHSKREYKYDDNKNMTLYSFSLWDSSLNFWKETRRDEFEYDSKNKKSHEKYYSSFGYDELVLVYKGDFQYDDKGNNILSKISYWDYQTKQFLKIYKTEQKYDSNNNLIELLRYESELNLPETLYYKRTYQYNSKNKITQTETYQINSSNILTGNERIEYSYNPKDSVSAIVFYNYNNLTWRLWWKYEYSYNNNGNILNQTQFSYNFTNGWIFNSKIENTYDKNFNLTNTLNSNWIQSTKTWRPNRNTKYEYDSKNNNIKRLQTFWNSNTNSWDNFELNETEFNINSKKRVYSTWNTNEKKWQIKNIGETTYNSFGYKASISDLNFYSHPLFNGIKKVFQYDKFGNTVSEKFYWINNSEWSPYYSFVFFYTHSVVTSTSPELTAMVYPNPFDNEVRIKHTSPILPNSIKLYDTKGSLIKPLISQENNETVLTLVELPKGLYILEYYNNNKPYRQKIYKE